MAERKPVTGLSFRPLDEDQHQHQQQHQPPKLQLLHNIQYSQEQQQQPQHANFRLQRTYPAVMFHKVSFSVPAANQQASPAGADKLAHILRAVDLRVPHGCIFGLLGPSSCGKTTLLRCLVGLIKPTSGAISLMCGAPGPGAHSPPRPSRVPGPDIGYMPQDLGLYEDFTIRQLLSLFGQYVRMQSSLIEQRLTFMARFLELPDVDRIIGSLSGGQKRRVSFAMACLHSPQLIILDEPTVGVDPLLRRSIWSYLRALASEQHKTIIITTHYIEEAAQADQVALMRAGRVLVQDTPKRLMAAHHCSTLEETFLKICNGALGLPAPETPLDGSTDMDTNTATHKLNPQSKFVWQDQQLSPASLTDENQNVKPDAMVTHSRLLAEDQQKVALFEGLQTQPSSLQTAQPCHQQKPQASSTLAGHDPLVQEQASGWWRQLASALLLIRAIMEKNYRRNFNSLPLVAFQFLLPMVQIVSFSLCVGGRPSNIGLGVVNLDSLLVAPNSTGGALGQPGYVPEQPLSLQYLSLLDPYMLSIRDYQSLEVALSDVRRGKLWAALQIGPNFTQAVLQRFDPDAFYQLEASTVEQSVVRLFPDRSNKILDMICTRALADAFRDLLSLNFEHMSTLPVQIKQVIFEIKPNLVSNSIDGYTESIAAGLLASLTYIMAAGLTTFIMVVERRSGILERTYTCGIQPAAYLLTHALFRSLVMMAQIALVLGLTFYVLKQPLVGSLWLAYLMLMVLNCTGISYGLLISSLVSDQNGAALTIVSSLVLKITLSGILWPYEAIPYWLRSICYCQPLTWPVLALKNITLKGADLSDQSVRLGFLVSLAWMLVFLTIASRRFKFYQH